MIPDKDEVVVQVHLGPPPVGGWPSTEPSACSPHGLHRFCSSLTYALLISACVLIGHAVPLGERSLKAGAGSATQGGLCQPLSPMRSRPAAWCVKTAPRDSQLGL